MSEKQAPAKTLSRLVLGAFASPAIPISAMGLPIVVYLPPFYAEDMGLGLALVGTVFMFTRFWDVFTDPVLGVVSDKLHMRWGRRRPWIALSVPIVMLSVYMVFMPTAPVTGLYLFWWMVVLYVGWTLLTISHLSWGAELTPYYHERSRVQGWREVALLAGMIAVLALPAMIEQAGDGNMGVDRVAAMGWFVIILLPLTALFALSIVPERKHVGEPQRIGFRRATRIVLSNKPLQWVLLADLVGGIGGGAVAAMFIFFVTYALKMPEWASILLLVYFVSGCIFIPVWMRLSYRIGKHKTVVFSSIFNFCTFPIILLVPPGNAWVALPVLALLGVNMAAGPFLFRSIMADVADHDNVQSGSARTGLYFSLLTMTNKIGGAMAVGITYPLLEVFGFQPGAINAQESVNAVTFMYFVPGMISNASIAVIMWFYPLGLKEQEELRRTLEEREQTLAAMMTAEPAGESGYREGAPAE